MKVEEFDTEERCCFICEGFLEGDPYRLTAKEGKVFEVCDRCWENLSHILEAEGVTLEGWTRPQPMTPRPRYWHAKD